MIDDYRMAKKKLFDDQPLFSLVVKQSPSSIVITDAHGLIEYVNPKFVKLTGYKLKEVIGQNPRILKSGHTSDKDYAKMWQTIKFGREWTGEFLNKKKNGDLYWEIASISPVKDERGKINHFVAVKEDITARKKTEAELLKSNKILKAISQGNRAVLRVTSELEYLKEACRIIAEDCGYIMVWIGYAEDDKNKTVRPIASAGLAKGYLENIKVTWANNEWGRGPTGIAIRTGKIAKCENMLTDPKFAPWREAATKYGYASSIVFPLKLDGRVFGAVSIYAKEPNPFSDNEIKLLSKLVNDLTIGVKTVRLNKEVTRMASFPRLNVMPVMELDLAGNITYANPASRDAFSDIEKKGIRHPLFAGIKPSLLSDKMKPIFFEAEINGKWYSSAAKFVPEMGSIRVYCMDTTKQMEALNELDKEKKLLLAMEERQKNFIAILGHELRNPLASIVLALDLIYKQKDKTSEIQEELEVIDHQARNISKLLKDLLDVSRLDRGRLELVIKEVDLNRIIYNSLGSVRPLIEQSKRQLKISSHIEQLKIVVDRLRIEQILINLLANAIKYSPEGSLIELLVEKKENQIFITIKDSGIGIAPDKLDHIFELFSQGEQSLQAKKSDGLGVGLYMARELARLHGGDVTAESRGVGQGSEFTLKLPIKKMEKIAPSENKKTFELRKIKKQDRVTAKTSKKIRVLSVDDNVELAKFIGKALKILGYDGLVVNNGKTALRVAPDFKPKFALLDLGMPEMDGFELVRKLKKDKNLKDTTFVAVSGFGQEADKIKAKKAGFEHYIVKPVRLEDLARLLSGDKDLFRLS